MTLSTNQIDGAMGQKQGFAGWDSLHIFSLLRRVRHVKTRATERERQTERKRTEKRKKRRGEGRYGVKAWHIALAQVSLSTQQRSITLHLRFPCFLRESEGRERDRERGRESSNRKVVSPRWCGCSAGMPSQFGPCDCLPTASILTRFWEKNVFTGTGRSGWIGVEIRTLVPQLAQYQVQPSSAKQGHLVWGRTQKDPSLRSRATTYRVDRGAAEGGQEIRAEWVHETLVQTTRGP